MATGTSGRRLDILRGGSTRDRRCEPRRRSQASVFGSQRLIPKSSDNHIARWVRRKSAKLRLVDKSAGRSSGAVWSKGGA